MYGMIIRLEARPGSRDELISRLVPAFYDDETCLTHIVAADTADDVSVWVTEVWSSREAHDEAVSCDAIVGLAASIGPLIASRRVIAEPVVKGGVGLQT